MTETVPEGEWNDTDDQGEGLGGVTYPEYPHSLSNHTYTWSPKLPDGSMLVIRSQTADGLVEAVENMAPLAGRLKAAWQGVLGTPQPAPQAPQFQAGAGAGVNFNPQTPPPNQPFAGQPAWQQAGALPPQQAGAQWGGGGGGGQQAAKTGPKPRPAWPQVYKINVPFAAKDAFKAFRNENQDALKGKVAWAGGGDYWIEGSVVQGFAQYSPVAA